MMDQRAAVALGTSSEQLRVLVANEPRAYREVIAGVVRQRRPDANVIALDPTTLDGEIERLQAHMTIHSSLAPSLEARALTVVALYPAGQRRVTVTCAGRRTTSDDLELHELLALVDSTEALMKRVYSI